MGCGPETFIAGRLEFIKVDKTADHRAAHKSVRGGAGHGGGRMPLTANLADRVQVMIEDPSGWARLPDPVREWLQLQEAKSRLPSAERCWLRPSRAGIGCIGRLLLRRAERAPDPGHAYQLAEHATRRWVLLPPTLYRDLVAAGAGDGGGSGRAVRSGHARR